MGLFNDQPRVTTLTRVDYCGTQEKEKADRKAMKAEKERREKDAQNKSRSLLSAFLAKPKPRGKVVQLAKPLSSSDSSVKPVASSSQSDFEKSFKPFVVKKDATIAPINGFMQKKKTKEVIVLDQDCSSAIQDNTSSNHNLNFGLDKTPEGEFLMHFRRTIA